MRLAKLIFLFILIVELVGCVANSGTGQSPTPAPSSSSHQSKKSAVASASATSTNAYIPASEESPAENVPLPDLPNAAKRNSKDGATAFAKYYFEVINYTVESNDTRPLKRLTSRECQICGETLIDPADRSARNGTWRVGGLHHANVMDSYMSAKDKAVVTLHFTADGGYMYNASREKPEKFDAAQSTVVSMGLEYDKGWKVYTALFGSD